MSVAADTFNRVNLVDAYSRAQALVVQHGLAGWQIEFDRAKRRAGQCREATRVISLSEPLTRLHDEAEVVDTILHEIAHALVGTKHGHDEVWRAKAIAIGCSGARCVDEDAPRVEGDWVGTCPAGHTREQHKRPEVVSSCRRCSDRFSVESLYEWTFRGRPATMHPNYVRQLENLRAGRTTTLLPVGAHVRLVVPGIHNGSVGVVVKRGRTSYHVQLENARLRVLFAGVELVERPETDRSESHSMSQGTGRSAFFEDWALPPDLGHGV
ncbi:SprT-like domain-containing protein [Nocardioides ochotonae]|uniref:SprT-like domain-containing protein n=1 Tax=Nocardioides ochotonae TaxID=2685869 RepID=UPI001CD809F3|nr:SprT-like domain-containing protein [Nocardioides ochotonae]